MHKKKSNNALYSSLQGKVMECAFNPSYTKVGAESVDNL